MPKEQNRYQSYDNTFLEELFAQCVDCIMDQGTSIIDRNNLDAFRECLLDLLKFLLYPVDDLESILPVAHHHNAADGFSFPVQFRDAPPKIRSEVHITHLLQINRSAVLNLQDDVIEIL